MEVPTAPADGLAGPTPTPDSFRELEVILNEGAGTRWARAIVNLAATAYTSAFGSAAAFAAALGAGVVSMFTSVANDAEQDGRNKVMAACIRANRESVREREQTLTRVVLGVAHVREQFADRADDPRYQELVRRAFAGWAHGHGEEKREMIRRPLTHAAEAPVVDYDMFGLFFDWVSRYNELHFRVMRAMTRLHRPTRKAIWHAIGGRPIRDDSAEADVFKCLIADLSIGHVLRQAKEVNRAGQLVAPPPKKRTTKPGGPRVLVSATDDEKTYVLTNVGRAFVHHVMDEVVPKVGR
jgi:hypothetical protein